VREKPKTGFKVRGSTQYRGYTIIKWANLKKSGKDQYKRTVNTIIEEIEL
jgi:hypothetical protein